jgi:8-oxo-dGTP diphosphatase
VGALGDASAHPSRAAVTVTYVAVVREGTEAPKGMRWAAIEAPRGLPARQRTAVTTAVRALRDRMDRDGIAFHLLPTRFTLAALQATYELLLEKRLHKASFRRTLAAAGLVEATDAWRSEGRGRPAQEFRRA